MFKFGSFEIEHSEIEHRAVTASPMFRGAIEHSEIEHRAVTASPMFQGATFISSAHFDVCKESVIRRRQHGKK